MHILTWSEISALKFALDDMIGSAADNSCGDPDCCGGPYYEQADFDRGERLLLEYGIKWNGSYQ